MDRKQNTLLTKVKTALAGAIIGLGALAAVPTAAQAEGLYFSMGTGGRVGVGVYGGSYEPVRHRHWHRPAYRACSNGQAVRKASRMGMRRAAVVRAGLRSVTVGGRSHYGWHRVTFARAPGCPVIR